MGSAEGCGYRRAIETGFADHDELAEAIFALPPRPVELLAEARADALHEKPHRLAAQFEKALDPQNVMALDDVRQSEHQCGAVLDRVHLDDEAFEIIVIVL
jgi:hypothetical protein